jgi:hypothetical protein
MVQEEIPDLVLNEDHYTNRYFRMPLAIDNIRVGRVYRLVNYGEIRFLEVMERTGRENFKVKDLETLEFYELEELLRWGKGKDYDLDEIR